MKKERLLRSIGLIDEKYIEEAKPKMKNSFSFKKILGIAACFAIIVGLGLYLFLPFRSGMMDLTAYEGSDYFPLIEKIEDYRYVPPKYKNNFEYLSASSKAFDIGLGDASAAPENSNTSGGADIDDSLEGSINGSYEEVTDNQVAGVIEADIFKRTDKYIFRLKGDTITVYSIEGESSSVISQTNIPKLSDEYAYTATDAQMYLSEDGNTITLIKEYINTDKKSAVGIVSIDASNVKDVKVKSKMSIDGSYNSSRMVDGKLLLITEYYFNTSRLDYANPETYVPSIDYGNGKECIQFENIIYPDSVGHTRYSVVALIDEDSLDMLGANALLNFTDEIYVSENNVYITREYTREIETGENSYVRETATDIAILGYDTDTLTDKGVITVAGAVKDQYSLDEYEGHLRAVASTSASNVISIEENTMVSVKTARSVSLYVFSLSDKALVATVKDFAPEGESAESVRFDGNTAYVCTAVVVTLTDPVYFFDLSDYQNITYTDTGVIDGYSTSLINLGEGFLLGIGVEDWSNNKVEIYGETNGGVESVDKFLFQGRYSTDYKSYLVNREENLFGFAVNDYYNEQTNEYIDCAYVILTFDGYEIRETVIEDFKEYNAARVRAAYIDGYIYLTGDYNFKVIRIN